MNARRQRCCTVSARRFKGRGVTRWKPHGIMMVAPTGSVRRGRGRPRAATVHSCSAPGQVTQPFLLQISISPLSFTDHAHRAPLAVLSMHIPTAVLPLVAKAALDGAMIIAAMAASTDFRISASTHFHRRTDIPVAYTA